MSKQAAGLSLRFSKLCTYAHIKISTNTNVLHVKIIHLENGVYFYHNKAEVNECKTIHNFLYFLGKITILQDYSIRFIL